MLSKRNFGMMMTIILVILILFLSSAVLREYFNDYNENHSADSEWVKRSEETKETKDSKNSEKNWHIISPLGSAFYIHGLALIPSPPV